MNSPFSFSKLLNLSGGFFVGERSRCAEPSTICIDSREAGPRSLFVPLRGERTDGHLHIESAVIAGSSAVLVEQAWAEAHTETLQSWSSLYPVLFFPVDDTLKQMQELAASHRMRFSDVKVIGVTGSNGKTTTKEMIAAILETMGRTYKNHGNLNSEIGLPLTVLRMNREYDFAVLEMGINHIGEMDVLVDIARPDTALITNIGSAHIGYLGSKRKIAEEKRKIFSFFGESNNAFISENEKFADVLAENMQGKLYRFGVRSLPELREVQDMGLEGQKLLFTDCTIQLVLPGIHNLNNALAAVMVTRSLGASWDQVRIGLENLNAVFGRSQILRGRIDIVQDCYNANPDSVVAAVRMLVGMPTQGRRLLVLGDMLELGEESEDSHKTIGRTLTDSPVDRVFFFGTEMKAAAREYKLAGKDVYHTDDYHSLEKTLLAAVEPGDLVLLKGSRGMELERLTAPLLEDQQKKIS
ncbi:UDP-N-acetylmuramoyl-tripeptide--D-alanyl-D-alanine ligase [Oceanispirochaeta sp.]|jgi:UDP-N-acetylmuramoyl-tripeptide--D-alanyl-D-alanine ligase|uniref:UDP-N-acetylmuramoyl-tripeptide--D-alanyl-D- alanine ligase n=1 Tax=Oceanispirochaeta sp. TaxID=2035350 RepID=UPI002609E7EC|nr:UDP-N-acetylmuramoyl-tripeptide--D-alanyl-D-alanine ligase [Oceanispirochaeta sp.]MDA3956599.1 UDP-N-acetylmuramoyl-tripeptide--D-alanyl-D-alanine ligase [Oceanispirochaeta sp.]